MNGREMHRLRFYQEELFDTKSKLFRAKSVKKLKFLQNRIVFLQDRIEEIQNNNNDGVID